MSSRNQSVLPEDQQAVFIELGEPPFEGEFAARDL
jgi:hypothetical protein